MHQQGNNISPEVSRSALRGTCRLSVSRDVPLLMAVRDATFVNRSQLETLMPEAAKPEDWRNRNARIRRLIALEQLAIHQQCFPYPGRVFSITQAGLRTLELAGMGILSVTSNTDIVVDTDQISHFLGLNAIQIEMRKVFKVIRWYGDQHLKSLNLSVTKPTAKDYDSIAFIANSGNPDCQARVGIEYERSLKSRERYSDIRKAIATETQIDGLIYFADNEVTANYLASAVFAQSFPICVAVTQDLYRSGVNCPMLTVQERQVVRGKLSTFVDSIQS